MDSGNSGSISSSGDEEYDSRGDIVPSSFLNPHPQFINSLLSSHHPPPFFDVSHTYLHPNSNLNPFLNLDTSAHHSQAPRSEPTCTPPPPLSSSSSSPATTTNNNPCLLGADPSLQLRSLPHDDARLSVSGSGPAAPSNGVRNPKKRTRASRRAPTTVLTTDTSNFRAMVQEFTGIPAPPFSASSYSRRLDLLTASSSFRSSHPLRPSPHKPLPPPHPHPHPHPHPNPSSLFASPSPSSTLMLPTTTTMVAANALASTSTTNYQIPPDHMLTMHILPSLHPFLDPLPPKAHQSLALPSLEDQLGITNANLMSAHQAHVSTSEAAAEAVDTGGTSGHAHGFRSDQLRSFDVACKLNFPASNASSTSFNVHDKNLDNTCSTRSEGNFDSWICSSD